MPREEIEKSRERKIANIYRLISSLETLQDWQRNGGLSDDFESLVTGWEISISALLSKEFKY